MPPTNELEREVIKARLKLTNHFTGQHRDEFEAAVDAKARADERQKIAVLLEEWCELEGAPPFVYGAIDIAKGERRRLEFLRKQRIARNGGSGDA